MRVIGGGLKGLEIVEPKGHSTRPMSTKIRNALFNSLGDLSGLRVIDCYGGTGALSLEAISRGAVSAVAIEKDGRSYQVMRMNIRGSGLTDRIQTVRANCLTWIRESEYEPFDIAIADPPFKALNDSVLRTVVQCLKPGGILILSHDTRVLSSLPPDCRLIGTKHYGQAAFSIYRRLI
jgi:16S rRNA (guanine966-N2)-methyltransferase